MKTAYPIEAMLRAPVEWWSAAVCGFTGSAALLMPNSMGLSKTSGLLLGLGCTFIAIKRFYQGWQVHRYQKNLITLPTYASTSSALPKAVGKLFLGKGFKWLPMHTQRLYDHARSNKQKPSELKLESEVGGNPILHGVEPDESNVWMNLNERVGHTLVLGTTRVGKTRLLEVLVSQDIERGECVIVLDPKGDMALLRRIVFEATRAGRAQDVLLFHLGFPHVSARYNPIGHFARITEVANRVANQLPSSGESAAFKEFAWRFVNIISRALVALGRVPDYTQIQRYILNIDQLLLDYCNLWLPTVDAHWKGTVQSIENEINMQDLPIHLRSRSKRMVAITSYIQRGNFYNPIADGLCSAFNYDKTYFDKITASLLPLLEKLTAGQSAELISPDYYDLSDPRPIFDWMQVIRGKKIVYVGLDALSDPTVAGAIGNSMFSDLCSVAGQLYKFGVQETLDETPLKNFHPVCVHADEFNELIGEDFIPLLNKAGGAKIQVTAYTQTWSDVEASLASRAKAGQVSGNLNTLICLRVLDEETAKLFTNKLPQRVVIQSLMEVSSVSDTPNIGSEQDFTSNNEDRLVQQEVPMITPEDLIQLPKGQAFVLLNGGELYKIRIPLPEDDMTSIPNAMEGIIKLLQQEDLT